MKRSLSLGGLLLAAVSAFAEPEVRWNLGTVDLDWAHLTQKDAGTWHVDNLSVSFLDAQLVWNRYEASVETSLGLSRTRGDKASFALLPVTVAYHPFHWGPVYAGAYAHGEVPLESFSPFLEGGLRLTLFVFDDPNRLNYSWKSFVSVGWNNRGEVSVATQLDLGSVLLAILALSIQSQKNGAN